MTPINLKTSANSKNQSLEIPNFLDPEFLLLKYNETNFDPIYSGYLRFTSDNGDLIDDSKRLDHQIWITEAFLDLYHTTNNSNYLIFAESLLNIIEKFRYSNGGYTNNFDRSFEFSDGLISSARMFMLPQLYIKFYNATNNSSHLNKAQDIIEFIESFFYDDINGGFSSILDANTLTPNLGYRRNIGIYGYYTNSLFLMNKITQNESYLKRGIDILNKTITDAWNNFSGYFHSYLYEDNQPDYNFPGYYLQEQVRIAKSLLLYSQTTNNSLFHTLGSKTIETGVTHLMSPDGKIKHSFDTQDGSILNSQHYSSNLIVIIDFLLDKIDSGLSLKENEQFILKQFFINLNDFLGDQTQLPLYTLPSESDPYITASISALVNLLIRLKNYSHLSDFPQIPLINSQYSTTTITVTEVDSETITFNYTETLTLFQNQTNIITQIHTFTVSGWTFSFVFVFSIISFFIIYIRRKFYFS
jgi:hypothetical protein